jgi:ribosomal protein L33
VFGDPYDNLVIKDNYFSVEHYGGSNWRWTRIMTFKYDLKTKRYVLHRDAGESYHMDAIDKTTQNLNRKKDFDKLPFVKYNSKLE